MGRFIYLKYFIFSVAVLTFYSAQALAGFQWVPAENEKNPEKMPPQQVLQSPSIPPAPEPPPETLNEDDILMPMPSSQPGSMAMPGERIPAEQVPLPPPPGAPMADPQGNAVVQSRYLNVPPHAASGSPLPPPTYEDTRESAKKEDRGMQTFGEVSADDKDGPKLNWIGRDGDEEDTSGQQAWESGIVPDSPAPNSVPVKTTPVAPAPVAAGSPPALPPLSIAPQPMSENYGVVEGFGNDLPLALALRQVVPPEYSYSFGSGVNPGLRVTWNGGKPWNVVVQDMVQPLNIVSSIDGKIIRFYEQDAMPNAAPVFSAPPPAPSGMNEPMVPRSNIRDPGPSQDLPLMPPPNNDQAMAPPAPLVATTPQELAARPKYSQQLAQEMEQENITMRMNADTYDPSGLPPPPPPVQQPYASGRPYPLEPYTPPSYQAGNSYKLENQAPSVSQKMAMGGNDFGTGHKLVNSQVQIWEAQKGDSLKQILTRWSREAGINLVWNSSRDYTVSSNVFVNGTFNNAIKTMFSEGIAGSARPAVKLVDDPGSRTSTSFIVSDSV